MRTIVMRMLRRIGLAFLLLLLLLVLPSHTVNAHRPFRFFQDGLGFSTVAGGGRISSLNANVTMTAYDGWPTGFVKGPAAFYGAVFDGLSIWLVPFGADRVIKIDPRTGNMTGYSNWPVGFVKPANAFYGGTFDGSRIWLTPLDADRIVAIHPTTGSMEGFNQWPPGFVKGSDAFVGSVFDGTHVWLCPQNADRVIRLDSMNGRMVGYSNWPLGFVKRNGAFGGCLFAAGFIWLVPLDADRVVRVNRTENSTMAGYRNWPSDGFVKRSGAFLGGVFDGRYIWLVPFHADRVVRLDPLADPNLIDMVGFSGWSSAGFVKAAYAFVGGVFDGAGIWLVPYSADSFIRIDPASGNMTRFSNWPANSPKVNWAFVGAVFDGAAIWLAPQAADFVIRLGGNRTGPAPWCTSSSTLTATSTKTRVIPATHTPSLSIINSMSSSATTSLVPKTPKSLSASVTQSLTEVTHFTQTDEQPSESQLLPSATVHPFPISASVTVAPATLQRGTATYTPTLPFFQAPRNNSVPIRQGAASSVSNSDVGKIVSTSGVAAAVAGSALSPTLAVQAGRPFAFLRVVECDLPMYGAAEDGPAVEEPEYLELPLQIHLSGGGGAFSLYVGSLILTLTTLVGCPVLLWAVLLVLLLRNPHRRFISIIQQKVVTNAVFMTVGYFVPIAWKVFVAVVTANRNSSTNGRSGARTSSGEEVAVVAACIVFAIFLFSGLLYVAVVLVPTLGGQCQANSEGGGGDAVVDAKEIASSAPSTTAVSSLQRRQLIIDLSFAPLYSDARDRNSIIVRVYFLEELLVSCMLQALNGLRPSGNVGCRGVAVAMTSVVAIHMGYLVLVRPYRHKIELALNMIGTTILLGMGLGASVAVFQPSDPPSSLRQLSISAVGYLALAESVYFFLQVGASAFLEVAKIHRRRLRLQWTLQGKPPKLRSTDDEELQDETIERGLLADHLVLSATGAPFSPVNSPLGCTKQGTHGIPIPFHQGVNRNPLQTKTENPRDQINGDQ